MPYINRSDRGQYQPQLCRLSSLILDDVMLNTRDVGEEERVAIGNNLRYSYLHHIVNILVNKVWGALSSRRYVDHQDVTGFLTCAAFEYNRKYTQATVQLVTPPQVPTVLKYSTELEEVLTEVAAMVPTERMLRSGHMNYFVSYLIDNISGNISDRTEEQHAYNETLLHTIAKEYYDNITAVYEDDKIREQGDLRDL